MKRVIRKIRWFVCEVLDYLQWMADQEPGRMAWEREQRLKRQKLPEGCGPW